MHTDSGPSPTVADIQAAADRIAPYIIHTPLLTCPALDARTGARVLLKAEPLQRTGSFKIRGALNRMLSLSEAERRAGAVAWSSGNHAQGVAAAVAMLGTKAVIVMPADAPALKIENTRALGAEVVLYDRLTEDRVAIGTRIASARGMAIVPPYDHVQVITGQGTLGLEAAAQAAAMGLRIDDVLAPASGGGLIAGVGVALRAANAEAEVYAVEPEGYDDHRRSIGAPALAVNATTAHALCDALLAATPGAVTWPINARQLRGGYAVSETEVCAAMAFAFRHLKLVVEPGGAVALAAILSGRHRPAPGRTVLVVLSGGNVDGAVYRDCLSRGETSED